VEVSNAASARKPFGCPVPRHLVRRRRQRIGGRRGRGERRGSPVRYARGGTRRRLKRSHYAEALHECGKVNPERKNYPTVNKKNPAEPVRVMRTGSAASHMQLSCPRYRSMIAAFSSCVAAAAHSCPHTRPQASVSQHNRPQCGRLLVRRRRAEERSRKYHLVAGARRKLSPCPAQGAKYRNLQGVLTPGRRKMNGRLLSKPTANHDTSISFIIASNISSSVSSSM